MLAKLLLDSAPILKVNWNDVEADAAGSTKLELTPSTLEDKPVKDMLEVGLIDVLVVVLAELEIVSTIV